MGVWHPTDGAKLYLNGELVASVESPSFIDAADDYQHLIIGRPNKDFAKYGSGWLDEIKIYYQALPGSFPENLL